MRVSSGLQQISAAKNEPLSRWRALALVLAFTCLILAFSRGYQSADGGRWIVEVERFVEDGHFGHPPDSFADTHYRDLYYHQGSDGKYYFVNESAMVLTSLPFYGAAKAAEKFVPERLRSGVFWMVIGLHSTVCAALCGLLLVLLARMAGASTRVGILAALVFLLLTPMLRGSSQYLREPFITLLHLLSAYVLLRALVEPARWKWWAASVGVLGFLYLAREPSFGVLAIAAGLSVLLLAISKRIPRRSLVALVAVIVSGLILGLGLQGVTDVLWRSGASGADTVSRVESVGSLMFVDVHGSEAWLSSAQAQANSTPPAEGWWVPLKRVAGMLISPGSGALWYSLPCLIGFAAGAWFLRGRKRWSITTASAANQSVAREFLLWLALWSAAGYVASIALAANWFSTAWGTRYIYPGLALVCIPCAIWMAHLWRSRGKAYRLALVAGAVVCAMVALAGTVANDRAIVGASPSYVPSVTRHDQAWEWQYMPLISHTERMLAPDFSRFTVSPGAGEEFQRQAFRGWVTWWALAGRSGLPWWLALGSAGAMLTLGVGMLMLVWRKSNEPDTTPVNSEGVPADAA